MGSTQRMWREFVPVRRRLLVAVALGVITVMSNISLLATSGWLIARAAQMPPVLDLSIAVVAVRTFALGRSIARYSERLVSHDATFRAVTSIRVRLFQALERMAPSGFTRRGDVLTRAVADVDALQDLPLRVVLPAASAVISAVLTVGLLSTINSMSAGIVGIGLLTAATLVPYVAHISAKSTQRALAGIRSELTSEWIDLVDGHLDITMLGVADQALSRIDDVDKELTRGAKRLAQASGAAGALLTLIQGVTLVAVAWTIAKLELNPVTSVLVGLLPLAVFETVAALPNVVLAANALSGSARRVAELLDMPIPMDPTGEATWDACDLSLRNVDASWDSKHLAISDISLHAKAGTRLALVGPSGSGKSTVLAVLAAFLRPTSGAYSIAGHDTESIAAEAIRNDMVLSSQDSHVFSTSIAENLRLVRPASDSELFEILRVVRLDDWVSELPQGINTVLGEFGATMSGGQRQRLLLARILLAAPHVWLLDEPTEHLDAELADELLESINQLAGDSTVIIATHRTADTAIAEQSISLSNGTMES